VKLLTPGLISVIPVETSTILELQNAVIDEPLGLYVHIPFCKDRCTYCSFVSTIDQSLKSAVIEKLCLNILEWGKILNRPILDTLYIGGGTPSLLTVTEVRELTSSISQAFDTSVLEEASIEVNPGTVSSNWLKAVRDLGLDRISIGVQALDDVLLHSIGRIHSSKIAMDTISLARDAGFARISGDLIVGVPGQDLFRVIRDAETLVESGINHLSVYLLDLDKNCILRTQVDSNKVILPTDDEIADIFEAIQDEFPKLGLFPYEISNYSAVGEYSKHNIRYWERRPYLGIGPSAASQLGVWRWTEENSINSWIINKETWNPDKLSESEILAEAPLLGLRMHNGINWDKLKLRSQMLNLKKIVDGWEEQLLPFVSHGLLEKDGPILRLTPKGILLSNVVFQVFIS